MGVDKYVVHGRTFWKVDEWFVLPDSRQLRFRQRKIPTREQAMALVAKKRAEAFEGRFFDRRTEVPITVAEVWALYEPISQRDNDTWKTEKARAAHLIRHLGDRRAAPLTQADVDAYRTRRLGELTPRKTPPSPATLDREIELLKRVLGYALRCGKLVTNPLASVGLLRKTNVRKSVVGEDTFGSLVAASNEHLKSILIVAYDTGMRLREVLDLSWSRIDLREQMIRLTPEDTKTDEGRHIPMTARVVATLRELPRNIHGYVFVNPDTGKPWRDLKKAFHRACRDAGIEGVWFHDLRRSFITNARRRGVSESVVMKISGHRTRAVFDRYNIVSDEDLKEAIRRIELGQELVKVRDNAPR